MEFISCDTRFSADNKHNVNNTNNNDNDNNNDSALLTDHIDPVGSILIWVGK